VGAVLLAVLAGASFGALTVAVRLGLDRRPDPELGALAAALVAAAAAAGVAVLAGGDAGRPALLPFVAVGLVAPGASQIVLTLAVRHAGPARAAIIMGVTPLLSAALAIALLGESFRLPLVAATALIVLAGAAVARERAQPERFRALGAALALLCAVLFATRDNLVRLAARDAHPSSLAAAAAILLGAAAFNLAYVALLHRERLRELPVAARAFAPAGIVLAVAYAALLEALDRGRVTVVSPLTATGSLWAVMLAALVVGRSERIGRRTVLAGALVVAGGALIGVSQ
jgi:drug/metabolite transporter (DMT)-like permease